MYKYMEKIVKYWKYYWNLYVYLLIFGLSCADMSIIVVCEWESRKLIFAKELTAHLCCFVFVNIFVFIVLNNNNLFVNIYKY
jgi:hypothetical protein